MADVRYTALGHFNNLSKRLSLELGIPNDTNHIYKLSHYNLTIKLLNGSILNVILTNLDFGTSELSQVDDYYYDLKINLLNDLSTKYSNIDIDFNNSDILFLLVHDDDLSEDNILYIKDNVLKYYATARVKSTYISEAYPEKSALVGRPRTLGMSIIKKP